MYICRAKLGIRSRYCSIEQTFDGYEAGGGCTFIARVINQISSDYEPCTMCFCFVLPDVADEASISRHFFTWDVAFRDETHRVCTWWHSRTYSVDEASELVGEGGAPDWRQTCLHEMAVF